MSAAEIIDAIRRLPPAEQAEVVRFAIELDRRRLSPDELAVLGGRIANAANPTEADRLTDDLVRGFYGGESHA